MSLAPGARLGPYEIVAPLGAGGMGEVYRARDTKLGRDVALKVLPDSLAHDAERLARFRREAQVLASLNHPHIAAIYGLEDAAGVPALILELVEGPTLADSNAGGPIPLDDALPIVRQIAEAVEAAHEQGIIHRDLKPANIKLRPDGMVKVLDFGLAKALAPETLGPPTGEASQSPTITSPAMTRMGVILGTAAYMSPEQTKGRPADKRSDVWAFGCVLYEMLTGKRAFAGDDVSDTLAAVLRSEPDWTALPVNTPPAIHRLLRRCLQKDRKRRLADMADARIEIEETLTSPVAAVPATAAPVGSIRNARVAWAVAAVCLLVAIAPGVWTSWPRPAPQDAATRTSLLLPDGWTLALMPLVGGVLAVSPDGRSVAFVAQNADGKTLLWVRSLDTVDARALTGTDGAASPFWSPDSRYLGFFSDGKLKKIDVAGGPAIVLCDVRENRGGTWSRDGVIVFSPGPAKGLQKVSDAGGVPAAVTVLEKGEGGHARPHFLPDGRHFLFRPFVGAAAPVPIYLGSLDSPERTLLFESDTGDFFYSRGHLIFLRDTTLMARPFDVEQMALTGETFPVTEPIQRQGALNMFAASENGVLVYLSGVATGAQLAWFDRAGKRLADLGEREDYGHLELSPDGTRAAVSMIDRTAGTRDLWLFDVARGLRTRFTFEPTTEYFPVWSPDSTRVVFDRLNDIGLYQKLSSGAGGEEKLAVPEGLGYPASWSLDGRFLLYVSTGNAATGSDLWGLPQFGDRKPSVFLRTRFNEHTAKFSPDGRWVAYISDESGRGDVYVTPFPTASGKWQISTGGGAFPRWRRDGKELFYLAPDNTLMAADVNGQLSAFAVGAVRPLFQAAIRVGQASAYDVTADGRRFLVNTYEETVASKPLTLVVNWTAGLKQ
jgi:eukaryotic-like serine/threonine-protein kinase